MKIEYRIGDKFSGFDWFNDNKVNVCFVTRISPYNGVQNTKQMDITEEQYNKWKDGEYIQDAFPNLTPDEREFILSGLTPQQFNELYAE